VIPKLLLPDEDAVVKVLMLCLGKVTLCIIVWTDNTQLYTDSYIATILLFFIFGIHAVKS